jgi:hypothetical protein
MDLHLVFKDGSVSGDGNDDIGLFLVRGKYDAASSECHWTKTYPGSHDVYYRRFREGKGIWGTWEIGTLAHGGFHIWPKGEQDGETETAVAEAVAPVEAIGEDQEDPFPVDRMTYDGNIAVLEDAVRKARIGQGEKVEALKRLSARIK